jgi:cobalamin biosynthesis protein CobC
MENFSSHGGRLAAAMRAWPGAPLPWIDLSTGINPNPYPARRASRAARARLPFPEEIADLEAAAGRAFSVTDPAGVVGVAGAEAGLRLLPRLLGADTVWIDAPTYASHAAAWAQAGARLAASAHDADAVVLVNPNNPDGRVRRPADLLALADQLQARGGWLAVDESFADIWDQPSIAAAAHPRIVALRSFGKFYGLAGLRLGFVLAPPDLAARLRDQVGDWPVSADAIAAGLAAYPDAAWRERTRRRLATQSASLERVLRRAGLDVVGGAQLFVLAETKDARAWFQRFAAAGILTRPFSEAPSWLRFGLPKRRDFDRVAAVLGAAA